MKKKHFVATIILLAFCKFLLAQSNDSKITFQWNGYYGSYTQRQNDSTPFIVAELPPNEKYKVIDESTTITNSLYLRLQRSLKQMLKNNYLSLITYDSSLVNFYVPYINSKNASMYEFRVIKNLDESNDRWKSINFFSKDSLGLYIFKRGFAKLGGFNSNWDNFLTVELRRRGSDTVVSAISVYWKQVYPKLLNIYTTNELNDLFIKLKEPERYMLSDSEKEKWQNEYNKEDLDSATCLPKKLILKSPIDGIIFYLKANVFKKEAVDYQVLKNGKTYIDWKKNDFDNNLIWLNKLLPGEYILRFRYAGQRHNVSEYHFRISPAWQQTTLFKIFLGGLMAAFLGFIILILVLKKQKAQAVKQQVKNQKIKLELSAIRTQLNPHFVFNCLNSIQGLINTENSNDANKYLSEFANFMRFTLSHNKKELISLDQEIEALNTYLQLEQLRYGFRYSIKVDSSINTSEVEIPFLLLQPLIENSIKHGIADLDQNGLVEVEFLKQESNLEITVSDNGKGFNLYQFTQGYGLKLTYERILLLNELMPDFVILLSLNPDFKNGTKINLLFKNWFI